MTVILLESSDKDQYEIVIEDNGIGMKQTDIPMIFSPFKRLDNARSYEGTGLGLATVQKIIDQHQGAIHVTSELEGTQIRLTFRAKQNQLHTYA